jgi:hypothetical protein
VGSAGLFKNITLEEIFLPQSTFMLLLRKCKPSPAEVPYLVEIEFNVYDPEKLVALLYRRGRLQSAVESLSGRIEQSNNSTEVRSIVGE